MAKKPNVKKKAEKSQSERFIETARTLEVDESGKLFERIFKRLIPPKRGAKKSSG